MRTLTAKLSVGAFFTSMNVWDARGALYTLNVLPAPGRGFREEADVLLAGLGLARVDVWRPGWRVPSGDEESGDFEAELREVEA